MITVKRFTAPWCAPCRMLAPALKQVEEMFPDVSFEVTNVDEDPMDAEFYQIRSVPTVLILKGDEIIQTIVGANPKQKYIEAIQSAL